MPGLRFVAMPTETVGALQNGSSDANGQPPERRVADRLGMPCRHCLAEIAPGEPFLILAHRPLPAPQPYAEVGPIFLHADGCDRYDEDAGVPPMLLGWREILLRGYGDDDRIVYGTGKVAPTVAMADAAAAILGRPDVAYVHVRSATNNCYQCRIEKASG